MARRPTCGSTATGLERGRALPRDPWPIEIDGLTLELRATEAGQVGLFPEHAAMLPWLRDRVAARPRATTSRPRSCTCSPTRGSRRSRWRRRARAVTHVDASRPTVTWARHNAERSGLADRPIRWIVDDALAFAEREVRRGRRYAGVVLDPPTYGHGPGRGALADRGRPGGRCWRWWRGSSSRTGSCC